ncbi:hypothetical protein F2Q70_00003043 [Brassica cretica]|uniref:Uncharacterized protein n=1 Tax=Brassica cretica TaxID=69181 RepID=A0A8S9ISR8_BRACR|nr:hypothetical protein F2Q70_00003043 [Brassica cretica]
MLESETSGSSSYKTKAQPLEFSFLREIKEGTRFNLVFKILHVYEDMMHPQLLLGLKTSQLAISKFILFSQERYCSFVYLIWDKVTDSTTDCAKYRVPGYNHGRLSRFTQMNEESPVYEGEPLPATATAHAHGRKSRGDRGK